MVQIGNNYIVYKDIKKNLIIVMKKETKKKAKNNWTVAILKALVIQ